MWNAAKFLRGRKCITYVRLCIAAREVRSLVESVDVVLCHFSRGVLKKTRSGVIPSVVLLTDPVWKRQTSLQAHNKLESKDLLRLNGGECNRVQGLAFERAVFGSSPSVPSDSRTGDTPRAV